MTLPPSHNAELERLLDRLQAGDRSAIPPLLEHCAPLIRRRLRGRMSSSMRRVLETEDLFATIALRVDDAVRGHRIRAQTAGELIAFIAGLSDRTVLEKSRWFHRMRRRERRAPGRNVAPDDAVERWDAARAVDVAIAALENDADRTLARLRISGTAHRTIAEHLGISALASRQRWTQVRKRLAEMLRSGS